MHIHVNGKNIEITDAIKAYVKEKIGKVANHYDQITGIDVILSVIKITSFLLHNCIVFYLYIIIIALVNNNTSKK